MKYRHPPIQEAICEIFFKIPKPWDQHALSEIRPRWQEIYPDQTVAVQRQFRLNVALDKMDSSQQEIGHKLVTRSADTKCLAQLGPNFLAVNRLAPYLGWEESFRDTILERLNDVHVVYGVDTIERIGLRYINRINVPQAPLAWSQWFTVSPPSPPLPPLAGGDFQSFYRNTLDPKTICQIIFGTVPAHPVPSMTSIILDIDVMRHDTITLDTVKNALEQVTSTPPGPV